MLMAPTKTTAYSGLVVFRIAPSRSDGGHTWDHALQLTKQLLAVQLLPVEGAGPIEQGVVLRVHCLDFIQRGFTTPDPLPEEVKRGQRALTRLSSLDKYSPMLTRAKFQEN